MPVLLGFLEQMIVPEKLAGSEPASTPRRVTPRSGESSVSSRSDLSVADQSLYTKKM